MTLHCSLSHFCSLPCRTCSLYVDITVCNQSAFQRLVWAVVSTVKLWGVLWQLFSSLQQQALVSEPSKLQRPAAASVVGNSVSEKVLPLISTCCAVVTVNPLTFHTAK